MNILVIVLSISALSILLFIISLFIIAYLFTFNIKVSGSIIFSCIASYFYPKIKITNFKNAYDEQMKKKLLYLNNLDLTELENLFPQKNTDEIDTLAYNVQVLLNTEKYKISLEQSKEILDELLLLNFFYFYKELVLFYSNPITHERFKKKTVEKNKNSFFRSFIPKTDLENNLVC